MNATIGRKVAVHGPSGSGKTTFARTLAGVLGVPAIELDAVYHCRPGWEDLTDDEFRAAVRDLLDRHRPDGWVIDGNYAAVRDLVHAEAESAIWLRFPFHVVFPRLVRRTLRRMWTREVLWGVNRESARMTFFSRQSILLWGITNWRPHRRKTRAALRRAKEQGVRVFVLRSPREASAFLARVAARADQPVEGAAAGS